MSSDSKFFAFVAVAAVLAIGAFFFFGHGGEKSIATVASVDTSGGIKIGADGAKVKIIEFGDFQCGACAVAAVPLRQVVAKNQPEVQLIFRHFPLKSIHKNAELASLAFEAAGRQNKHWEMYDRLYERQAEWQDANGAIDLFSNYAETLGLDRAKFREDLRATELKQRVNDDFTYGESLGVDRTPTFFVNGEKVTGALTENQWQGIIDKAKAG